MPRKPPAEERKLILARDQRRKYGARLTFQVQQPEHIGDLENVTLLLDDGTLARIEPGRVFAWEGARRYEIELTGYPTASDAEHAGMRLAQALLLTAVSLNFGLRLNYHSHEPPAIFDRTVSTRTLMIGEGVAVWSQEVVLKELTTAMQQRLRDRRLLLSMELFVSAALESNDRAKFVMAVSALEPLATQVDLGPEVTQVIDELVGHLTSAPGISAEVKQSLLGRLRELKRESVRQALKRLCSQSMPDDTTAWQRIERAYTLRSELLHEGRPNDLDIVLAEETQVVSNFLRRIYQHEFSYQLRIPVAG